MSLVLEVWCVLAIGFTVTAMVGRRRAAALPASSRRAPVLLLRPVDVPTPLELENLSHVAPGVEQLVVSPEQAGAGTWLRSDPRGFNRKLGHLQAALTKLELTGPVLLADADVLVDEALVEALLAGLEGGAELTWASPAPLEPGVERGLLVQSAHSFEVLDALSPGSAPLCGKAMALSPAALQVLRSLPDCVGEDLELASALHLRGLRTRLVTRANLPGRRTLSASYARFTRWMQVLRAHRGALFPSVPLLFACTPLLMAGAALAGSSHLWALVLVLLLSRFALATLLEGRPSPWWFAAEGLLLASWLSALRRGTLITWRGRVLRMGPGGLLR